MKRFPYTSPELGFIVFVMLLPLAFALVWRSETFLGLLARAGVGMVVGFGIWLSLIFVVCRRYDRKKRDENDVA